MKGSDDLEELQISLASARVNANMTQDDVAQEMQVSKRTIVNWESGKVLPSLATIEKLSRLYNIPINNIRLQNKST